MTTLLGVSAECNFMAGVTLEHVTKEFSTGRDKTCALDDLTVSAGDHEFLVLLGPSGCGKTTTLRLIAGLDRVTAGTIRIADRVVNDVSPKDRDVAMVFQNYALYPHMTVFKNMAFGLKMRRVPKDEIRKKVTEVAHLLDIEPLLGRKPASLSGGERQRVALGRAIVRDPKVFLFDEPLANLDVGLRVRMRMEIKTLHRKLGATVVYVTHDQEEALTMGDRVVVLERGVLQQSAAPLELYQRPANRFVAGFIGTPAMNFIDGRLEERDQAVRFNTGRHCLPFPPKRAQPLRSHCGRAAVLGVRPQHVRLIAAGEKTPTAGDPDGSAAFGALGELRVDLVEPLGDRIHVYLDGGTTERLVATLSPEVRVSEGDRMEVGLDMAMAHVFQPGHAGRRLE